MKRLSSTGHVTDAPQPRGCGSVPSVFEARASGTVVENLDLVNRCIGRGDPVNSLWFVDLEESVTLDRAYLEVLRDRERTFKASIRTPGGMFWQTAEMIDSGAGATWVQTPEARKLLRAEARIRWELDRDPASNDVLDEYARDQMWRERTFHCNLYGIGYQRQNAFPPEYVDLLGVDTARHPDLLRAHERRQRWLRELVTACQPAAVICLGLEHESELAAAVGASVSGMMPRVQSFGRGRRVSIYRSARTIVMQHLSRAGYSAQRDVVDLLRQEWRISL